MSKETRRLEQEAAERRLNLDFLAAAERKVKDAKQALATAERNLKHITNIITEDN
mgnify:CR=1 FL=1